MREGLVRMTRDRKLMHAERLKMSDENVEQWNMQIKKLQIDNKMNNNQPK